jgi:phosphoribosylaminoimidazole-succinocarboxamide synthase
MMELLYQGSVKDVRGPVQYPGLASPAVVFDYTDAYSVFDWGKMPDLLPFKGASLAMIAADWFEKLERAESWREFSKSPEAHELRRGNRFGAELIELGENLQKDGLRTHYFGVPSADGASLSKSSEARGVFQKIAVKPVSVVKPQTAQLAGRSVSDYTATRQAPLPRLVPLEVVFRFSCPPGSSLLERVARDPSYLASLGYSGLTLTPGMKLEFPILEFFTKLESTDRPLTTSEALAISGISAAKLQEIFFKTAWVAGWIKSACARAGLELADGKLEWALDERGEVILVDAIGPDELRILQGGVQLSKEFLRTFYRETPWYASVQKAKAEASHRGSAEWKKWVVEGPTPLPPAMKELASQLYRALANELTGRSCFPDAWPLSKVIGELHAASGVR